MQLRTVIVMRIFSSVMETGTYGWKFSVTFVKGSIGHKGIGN